MEGEDEREEERTAVGGGGLPERKGNGREKKKRLSVSFFFKLSAKAIFADVFFLVQSLLKF